MRLFAQRVSSLWLHLGEEFLVAVAYVALLRRRF